MDISQINGEVTLLLIIGFADYRLNVIQKRQGFMARGGEIKTLRTASEEVEPRTNALMAKIMEMSQLGNAEEKLADLIQSAEARLQEVQE